MVVCPICSRPVKTAEINNHLDSQCTTFVLDADHASGHPSSGVAASPSPSQHAPPPPSSSSSSSAMKRAAAADFFASPAIKRQATASSKMLSAAPPHASSSSSSSQPTTQTVSRKRPYEDGPGHGGADTPMAEAVAPAALPVKKHKASRAAPLAERMRPVTLDDVAGQDLVGPGGVLRALIESDAMPSIILWGGSGTGKTTIARCIAKTVGSRFVEINATSCGTAECKKLFHEAASEQALTGRRTIIFCDEIHRFSKSQQDVFLKPVEAGTIILVGATTENPSFKVQAALLSRCRTFTLQKLTAADITGILMRALKQEFQDDPSKLSPLVDQDLLDYLAAFSDGDARTALNLLELALSLITTKAHNNNNNNNPNPNTNGDPSSVSSSSHTPLTKADIKAALTKTLVYDRAGDQHYDTISAFHKSVRGSDPDAALYYLARMLQSGEDPLFIARRMVVIASEDVGLADNTLLPLATAMYTAVQQIGMPEARIPMAHCATALCLAPKSTRAYRGLNNAYAALQEPGVAALPVPVHLRNAPTRLMKEMGYGAAYKYNPNYRHGKVKQDYLPEQLLGRTFLGERDLGTEVDPDLEMTG
ncbi:hypothetical protein BD289DRAFT_380151 [Coniella lustricola]|uniref:DNA polymerase III, clamp loader complex, gamma/delta/delta subunit n=1 Tax=Coniella lustricola TaxID=2025994 RepID=A0A2T2ZRQ9_9PEZI|nr:hypothetical protein BD289DRAFT_380151 [Coniella lustricola]